MGITGLIPFLDKASEKINIQSLRNSTVAIDSYCWLHKGAFGVADKLARGEDTDGHILYCLKYVNLLLNYNIKPILVFDGRHLPAKADTEAKRRESRKNAKQRATELMRLGRHDEARNFLRRCVDITHEMALKLIQACRAMNVDCIVAPYEADGQLAFLNRMAFADYVITEDSDLVLFGCQRILFKLDLTGACLMLDAAKLHLAMGCLPQKFSMDKFRYMCILSGCDYLDSLPGIGLAKACKFILKTEETDMWRALDKIPAYLNMRNLTVTEEYKTSFLKANATFQHMIVFDPTRRRHVPLTDPAEVGTDLEFCSNAGTMLDNETALDLAVGNLNPFTMKRLDNWHPDQLTRPQGGKTGSWKQTTVAKHPSIWRGKKTIQPPMVEFSMNSKRTLFPKTRSKSKPEVEMEENDDESGEVDSDALLKEYQEIKEPPSKKFKEKDDPLSSPTASKRNPFKMKESPREIIGFESPTKITRENSSLVRNQSPIKRIDYNRLEKLSKFSRTVVSNQQNVISRFFTTNTKTEEEEAVTLKTEATAKVSEIKTEFQRKIEESESLYLDVSSENEHASPMRPKQERITIKDEDENSVPILCQENFKEIADHFQRVKATEGESSPAKEDDDLGAIVNTQNEEKQEESASEPKDSSSVEVISDDSSQDSDAVKTSLSVFAKQNPAPKANSVKNSKSSCRRPGLSKTKLAGGPSLAKGQSLLSMFGFQKKPQAP